MSDVTIYDLTDRTAANTDYTVIFPFGGPSGRASLTSVLIAALNMPNSSVAGAGSSIIINAPDGVTSGAGGSVTIQPGAQATTGGDGVIVLKQPAASTVADTVQIQTSASTVLARVNNAGAFLCVPQTTSIAVNTNDLALGNSSVQRLNCTAASDLTGIAPATGTSHQDGRVVRLYNVGTFNLTLKHNSSSSSAANRMYSILAVDIVLAPNDYAELLYDASGNGSGAAGWRVA